jgi:hypothetical protein
MLLHIAVIFVPVPDPELGFTGMTTLMSILTFCGRINLNLTKKGGVL